MNPSPFYQVVESTSQHLRSVVPNSGVSYSGSYPAFNHTMVTKYREEDERLNAPNIVIYGETGVGKSSIINLIADQNLAPSSGDALGCTFQHQKYIITLNEMQFALWDTTGLDEGTEGAVPARLAENNLKVLMGGLAQSGGIHLLIYCIRGNRLTKAIKRNYDLFYVAICRKKVPVALVVTGLEHQQGEMETWWTENETALHRYGMYFDAHACVTTLSVGDQIIQQRQSDSQRRLRELVVRFSTLPAWKSDASFISRVLPMLRNALRRTSYPAKLGNATIIRKVVVCDVASDAPTELSFGITAVWDRCTARIDDKQYEFIRVDKHTLQMVTHRASDDIGDGGAGVLVFYTSPLLDSAHISPADVDALRRFYDIAIGHLCPMIVVLRGCDDDEVARVYWDQVVSRHKDIQAYVVPLATAANDQIEPRARLAEMIERLCIEHVQVKTPIFHRRYSAVKRFLATIVEEVTSVDRVRRG